MSASVEQIMNAWALEKVREKYPNEDIQILGVRWEEGYDINYSTYTEDHVDSSVAIEFALHGEKQRPLDVDFKFAQTMAEMVAIGLRLDRPASSG